MMFNKKKYFWELIFGLNLCMFLFYGSLTFAVDMPNTTVNATDSISSVKVAPGEFLPVSVKLSNFGAGQRVDVLIAYEIFNSSGERIYHISETVAVETTINFVKKIQIPQQTPPGEYTAKASLVYEGQLTPATTQFPFIIENKILGIFQSDFYFYLLILIVFGIITGIASRFFIKKLRMHRITVHEYPDIPAEDRIFYEIISDIIIDMRYRVGDKAIDIAKSIDDLVVDENNGKVIKIKADPAKIVALLILQYEKLLGKKVSFAIKKPNEVAENNMGKINKSLIFIKKYF